MLEDAPIPPRNLRPCQREASTPWELHVKNISYLGNYQLQIRSVHFDRGMLVNQFNCRREKPHCSSPFFRGFPKTLHNAAPDSDLLADNEIAIRFYSLPTVVRRRRNATSSGRGQYSLLLPTILLTHRRLENPHAGWN